MAKIKLTNYRDLVLAERRGGKKLAVRTIEIEALVDTGATTLVIPAEAAKAIGLGHREMKRVRYADGRTARIPLGETIELELVGRRMTIEPLIERAGTTALIGQIPLEAMELVVDPKSREVRVNPASPDMPTLDLLFSAAE